MKQLFLTALASLFLFVGVQAQTYQDTTFTDPVLISFPLDFVTFQNCRFVGIEGAALSIEGAGVLVSNCTFEGINGFAITALASEVYVVDDTIRDIMGTAIRAEFGALVLIRSQISQVSEAAVYFKDTEVAEVTECDIFDVGAGAICQGPGGVSEMVVTGSRFQRINGIPGQAETGNAIRVDGLASVTITDCVLDSCMTSGIRLGQASGTSTIDKAVVQKNIISRTNLDGIGGQENVYGATILNNEISFVGFLGGRPNDGDHGIYWQGPDARIEGNYVHHVVDTACGQPYCGTGISIRTSATIVRNRIHNCTGNGIQYFNDHPAGTEALSIYNNIIYDVAGNPLLYHGGGTGPFSPSEPNQTMIRNNTMLGIAQGNLIRNAPIAVCCNDEPVFAAGNILIYEGESDTAMCVQTYFDGDVSDYLNLKSSSDLGFIDYAGRDFHLASELSPAHNLLPLNFGLPNDDFDGDLRLGLRDAGADELSLEEVICGCNNCPNEIPDLFFGEFTFAVVAADNNDLSTSVQGVCGVRVEFDHEYIGDISMELVSPAGQTVQLVGPTGFFGSTSATTWNVGFVPCAFPASPDPGFSAMWGSNQSWGEDATYTGIYYPAGGCLEDFNTGTVTGDWTLRVFDNQVDDNGTVRGFEVMFCDENGVSCFLCSEPPTTLFTASPAGAWGASIVSQTTGNITNYVIDYGDGQTASGTSFPSFHLYENAGTYLITLIATNDCGSDTLSKTVVIAGALPVAFAYTEPAGGCAPLTVQTVVLSVDHVDSWHWFFPGGTPSESFDEAPLVTYPAPGEYFATLVVENEVGINTLDDIFSVYVQPSITNVSYAVEVQGDSLVCTNTTQNVLSYYWTLDGGQASGANTSPYVFEVGSTGNYTVGLTLVGICDTLTFSETVFVEISGTQSLVDAGWKFALSPNPNDGQFRLNISAQENLPARVSILNTLGMEVLSEKIQVNKGENLIPFDLNHLPAGVYHLQIQTEKGWANLRVVIG